LEVNPRWSWLLIAVGAVLIGAHVALPEGVWTMATWHAVTFGSVLAMLMGRRSNRPPYRQWRTASVGVALFAVAGLVGEPWMPEALAPYAGHAASAGYALGLALLGLAVADLTRIRGAQHSREALLDSTIVTVALATVLWELSFEHTLHADGSILVQAPVILFPLASVWVFSTTLRLLFMGGSRHVSGWLLIGAASAGVIGNAFWALLGQRGGHMPGGAVSALWLGVFVLLAASAAHPSVRQLGVEVDRLEGRGVLSRVALLAVALLAPPVALVLHGRHAVDSSVLSAPVVASAVLSLLVCWRFATLVVDREQARYALEGQAERHHQLVRLGERALAGMPVPELCEMAERIVRTYLPARSARVTPSGQLVRRTTDSLHVPIGEPESPAGILVAMPMEPVGQDGNAFLQAVANVLASAIQRTRAEDDVRRRSLHDQLTGLPNRVLLQDRLLQALLRLNRRPGALAVLFADLDGFKEVNDTLGHAAGDRLLKEIARRLQGVVRTQDTLSRWAGDEFVVIVEDTEESAVMAVVERMLGALREPVRAVNNIALSGSVGVAFAQTPDVEPDVLLRQADAAMYLAKASGRDRHAVFDESMRVQVERRHRIERDLRDVASRDELRMVYQPFIALGAGGAGSPVDVMVAVEALTRWDHPELGAISPGEFIPVAESTGSIINVGGWILRRACEDLAAWRATLPPTSPFTMFVNLSPVQLSEPRLLDLLDRCLEETGVDPHYLGFELTESAVLEDDDHITRVLAALKERGCRIALDDFGTGYSSLAHLRRVPLDLLKVDASFVDRIGERGHDRAIVSAVVGLSRELGFVVLAEGIETAEQLESVRDIGCDLAQGFYFGRPASADTIAGYLSPAPAAQPVGAQQ
jgi:diguanylate cyclase (GGDEF)-like protein